MSRYRYGLDVQTNRQTDRPNLYIDGHKSREVFTVPGIPGSGKTIFIITRGVHRIFPGGLDFFPQVCNRLGFI